MVKDEDVCVHCGLCAERCPTAAWDMQKFELLIPYAGKTPCTSPQKSDRINDFAFKLATVNGTGSASANSLLMQAIFRMGIPVSGKNLFPSNIQGLPTWYEIRVNKDGYTARTPRLRPDRRDERRDLRDATSPRCARAATCSTTRPGRSTPRCSAPDVTFLGVPLAKMCIETFAESRERTLMKNIVYVGALAALLDIDMDDRRRAARREVRRQEGAARVEPPRDPARLRLRDGDTSSARCRSGSRRWTPRTTRS